MHRILLVLPLFAILAVVGCGGGNQLKTNKVSGTVTLDGQPVEGANLGFSPVNTSEGTPAGGRTDAAGRYRLQTPLGKADAGTTPGRYKVTISKAKMVGTGQFRTGDQGKRVEDQQSVQLMPAKTADIKTTDIEVTVENKGENVFNFDLKSGT